MGSENNIQDLIINRNTAFTTRLIGRCTDQKFTVDLVTQVERKSKIPLEKS